VVDLHVDSVIQQRLFRYDLRRRHRPFLRRQPLFWHADIPRMLEGGYTAAGMTAHWFPWESERGWRELLRQIDYVRRVAERDPRVTLAHTASDIERAHAEGRLAMLPVVEGAHMLNRRLDRVPLLAERGVLYLTLTHFSKNAAVTPGMGRGANQRDGLSPFGRELVRALETHRVLVDLAHLNRPGVLEVCEVATRPVIASHTCCAGVHDHPRSITDEGLRAIAATGGVAAIMFAPNFQTGRLDASIDTVVDHALHAAGVMGPEHVALGTDFDGWLPAIPNDIRDCRDVPYYTQRLLDRGMSEHDVTALLGGNILRVLRTVRG
jgi:membrane dipeptidase